MGSAQSQQTHIREEFTRVSRLAPVPTAPPALAQYIVLDQVLQLMPPRENPIDLTHLGTLYVIDRYARRFPLSINMTAPPMFLCSSKYRFSDLSFHTSLDGSLDGRFYLQDLLAFADLYAWQAAQSRTAGTTLGSTMMGSSDFQTKFQAYCTLQMWGDLSAPPPSLPTHIPHPLSGGGGNGANGVGGALANGPVATKAKQQPMDGALRFAQWFGRLFAENGPVLSFEVRT